MATTGQAKEAGAALTSAGVASDAPTKMRAYR